jgi:hypothetical protein
MARYDWMHILGMISLAAAAVAIFTILFAL